MSNVFMLHGPIYLVYIFIISDVYFTVIEWCWVHSTITGNRFFLYLNTKLKYMFAVKICCLSFPKFIHSYTSYTNVNVTVHINSS